MQGNCMHGIGILCHDSAADTSRLHRSSLHPIIALRVTHQEAQGSCVGLRAVAEVGAQPGQQRKQGQGQLGLGGPQNGGQTPQGIPQSP